MTLNLKPLGPNRTEIEVAEYKVLFSYRTPVAMFDKKLQEYRRTAKNWSHTTNRHILNWLPTTSHGYDDTMPQGYFDSLL